MLNNGPGDGEPVKGSRAATNFVEQHEACGSRVIENGGNLAHLHEKCRAPARKIIAGADAREDAVGNGQLGLSSRNEGAHLRHENNQRGLAQIGGLAAHVGTGDEKKLLAPGLEAKIVGNEALALLPQKFFNDRMPPADDEKFAGGIELRADVAAIRGQLCKRGEDIQLRLGRRGASQTHRLRGNGRTDIHEQLAFDFENAFVGGKNLALVFLELGGSEAFGVDQRLLALIVRRREMQIRFRNLNVIAKNLIETDFERADSSAFAFPLFHGRNDLFAMPAQIAQLVELAVIAAANHSRIRGERRRLIRNGAFELFAHVRELVNFLVELAKKFAAACGRRSEEILQHRELYEGPAQCDEL